MKIEEWKRPSEWATYPEMEDQIWEINHFKSLCLFLQKKTDYDFDISFEDETCIFVTILENKQSKAECYVNRGDTEEPVFSIFSGKDANEFHCSSEEEVLKVVTSSKGYMKQESK